MYCPNCTAVIEGSKYCRACGANVSLVAQALTGQLGSGELAEATAERRSRVIEKAVSSLFSGLGLIVASIAVLNFAPGGRIWWYWLLVPAFASIGHAASQYLRYREIGRSRQVESPEALTARLSADRLGVQPGEPSLERLQSGQVNQRDLTPASVVEQTTRHLEPLAREGGGER